MKYITRRAISRWTNVQTETKSIEKQQYVILGTQRSRCCELVLKFRAPALVYEQVELRTRCHHSMCERRNKNKQTLALRLKPPKSKRLKMYPNLISARVEAIHLHWGKFSNFHRFLVTYLSVCPFVAFLKATYAENAHSFLLRAFAEDWNSSFINAKILPRRATTLSRLTFKTGRYKCHYCSHELHEILCLCSREGEIDRQIIGF